MPIITVAMYSGRTQRDKGRLAEAITQLFWRSKSDAGSDTHNEKAGRGYNSEHNVFGRKSIFSTLEGLSESIQYELELFGIKIIVIEPGGVGSNFLKNLKMAAKTSDLLTHQ